ncbi:fibronectin/fibrinogen-binding protein [Paenalkalicoccus suaedae]|uniref:Rqc2 homolog RqcH n=1 Tax=Paenalkalicoccus suaedae TaxID=2592382 RepID=A0A859FFN7_9BACI|nr:NFACT RNA binding domain-containing protein [Paenalkalicoccus suaedae]QKS71492.1 fibronectin/fibrinogen-binding protein [Paenalkalicoccus suaedae]
MSFDGIVTRAVTHDLKQTLVSGRITKIHQPHPSDIVITVRAHGKNHSLFISVNPSFARFHLTNIKFDNPSEPPLFCMVLRKHLEGSIVEAIEQDGLERVITFSFKGRNELGDVSYKKLKLELMGRHSNLIFLDNEMILESIKHIPPSLSQYRTVLPGQMYVSPPHMDKLHPLQTDRDELLRAIDFNSGKLLKQIQQVYSGLSPQVIEEILHRAKFANSDTLPQAFLETLEPVKQHDYSPFIYRNAKKEGFSVIPLTHIEGERTELASVHEMLDRFYHDKSERDRVKQRAHDLERFIRNEYQKNKKKRKKLESTLQDADKAKEQQKFGELLTANMHLIKPGMKSITVVDYYDEDQNEITIPLVSHKSASDNAQQFFRKYTKLKNSVNYVNEQLRVNDEEIAYFENLLEQMSIASTRDIEDIREELIAGGYMRDRKQQKKKKKPSKPSVERYVSSEGIDLYVGKNNKQNEYLTTKLSRQDDTWLHTKDIPGSHVLIRSTSFGEETLMEAANLAAYFSKSRMSGNVPVDYTLIRHVKKPSGAKPGYVTYDKQTTVYVTPDEDVVRKLKA